MLSLLALLAVAADPKPADYAAAFPALGGMYTMLPLKPEVGKGDKPEAYKQAATYSWNGGRIETLTVTLARDPAFKEKYSAEAMKKEKATEVEVGKRKAYLWEQADEKGKRLVVVLADDKAVIVEQVGSGKDITKWAGEFDLDKMAKALDTPPATK